MKNGPRLLIFEGESTRQPAVIEALTQAYHVDVFAEMDKAISALRRENYEAVFADTCDFLPLERALVGQQASLVLNTIGEGVCIIDDDGTCRWSNNQMRRFSAGVVEKVQTLCCQARPILEAQSSTPGWRRAPGSNSRSSRFTFCDDRDQYFEVIASPVLDKQGKVRQVVAVVWDATSTQRLQQKIGAIDSAGRELTRLDTEQITKLTPDERLQLLQDKIITYAHDLLHFDHFAIRLLDKRNNKLEVVIAEGMPEEAKGIDLYAHPEGSGISGYVAATSRSYICHDTEKDPRYVLGIDHSKSSLTVPLRLHDKVIGAFNIESQAIGAFNEDDRQFAEIFGRYIALALNMLQLLLVERSTTTGQMADSVVQDLAQPVNDIITDARTLIEHHQADEQLQRHLAAIMENAQMIRDTMQEVAAGHTTVRGAGQVKHVASSDRQFGGKRILIADDESNIRDSIATILRKHGCLCTVCKDGYEAIHKLEAESFDLVLSDIKMPNRNGYEIFAAAQRCKRELPVILMTGFGYDPNHAIVRASQEGLSGVLFKPFKVDQLLAELRKALLPAASSTNATANR